jgi:cell shape-determining protein MreD
MWIDLAFVFGAFMVDTVIRLIFPIDTALTGLVFVPNLGFLAYLFVSLKKPMLSALVFAALLGLLTDLIRLQSFSNVLAFPISIYAIKVWSKQLNESVFELVFIGTIGLFIKEFAAYLILFVMLVTKINIGTWFVKREFMTLIGHIPFLILLIALNRVKNRTQNKLVKQRQRRESIRWNPTAKP